MGKVPAYTTLLKKLIETKVIQSRKVLSAFKHVDRKDFVPEEMTNLAYKDQPLPIGEDQTISQPSTVAIMIEALEVRSGHKILEIGTGSGFQTALISYMVGSKGTIISLERLPLMYQFGKKNLRNNSNVELFCSDGTKGYPYKAPYDRIIVSAEAQGIPEHLFNQLKFGGILIIPVKGRLLKVQNTKEKELITDLGSFAFVPLVGDR